jgi:hypothetical protein
MHGYPDDAPVPTYRVWSLLLTGNFAGSYGSGMTNQPIPPACIPEKLRAYYQQHKCRNSISSVHAMLRDHPSGSITLSTGNLAVVLGDKVFRGQSCIHAWADYSTINLQEVINTVRNGVLDFALALEQADPSAGDVAAAAGAPPANTAQRADRAFYLTINGGTANIVGNADHSIVTFNVQKNDIASLTAALEEHGVLEADIAELATAL